MFSALQQRCSLSERDSNPNRYNRKPENGIITKLKLLNESRIQKMVLCIFILIFTNIAWLTIANLHFDDIIEYTDPDVKDKVMVVQAGYSNYFRSPQGMFADTHHILGAIIYGLKRNAAAIRVDFSNSRFYHDKRYGNDWWSYYFNSTIELNGTSNPKQVMMDRWMAYHGQLQSFTHYIELDLNFPVGYDIKHLDYLHGLFKKYFHVRPQMLEDVAHFKSKHVTGEQKLIGIHFRGTDKLIHHPVGTSGSEMTIFDAFKKATTDAIAQYANYKIFIASDEHLFKGFMSDQFGKDRVFWLKNSIQYSTMTNDTKSKDIKYESAGLHKSTKYSGFEKSYSAMFDMLMLAESDSLIRSRSSLSDTSVIFAGSKLYYKTTYIDENLNLLKN